MPNPIQYQDLFGDSVNSGLQGLIQQVGDVKNALVGMLAEVKKQAESTGAALSGTSSATKTDRDATSQYAAEIERLHKENEKLIKSIDTLKKQFDALNNAQKPNIPTTVDLAKAYDSISEIIQRNGIDLNALLTTQRQKQIADKNGKVATDALAGSYNKLYAQYNLIKNVLNALGRETEEEIAITKDLEKEAARLMEILKAQQAATGRNTLDVGNYSKALNGLNISTQQVLREMPTLANSFSQFFIAISNNVPIFVDNLKRVAKETGSWTIAMKGVLTSIFSWQTALLVLLTILPGIAKNIRDKKKAQEEDNDAVKAGTTALQLYNKALLEQEKAATSSISKLQTLYKVATDNTKADGERAKAIEVLRKETEDLLVAYDDEAIKAGAASDAIQELTDKLIGQAKVRGSLSSIEEYSKKINDLELAEDDELATNKEQLEVLKRLNNMRKDAYKELVETEKISAEEGQRFEELAQAVGFSNDNIYTASVFSKSFREEYKKLKKELKDNIDVLEAEKALMSPATRKEQAQAYEDAIDQIIAKTDWSYLKTEEADEKSSRSRRSRQEKEKDYYWTWLESIVKLYENEQMKEVMLSNLSYMQKIETYKKELAERENLTKEQERYLTDIITNLEEERQQKRQEIIFKHYDETWKGIKERYARQADEEEVMEEDVSITGRYEKILARQSEELLKSREALNKALSVGAYREAKTEGQAFKELTIEKLNIEADYQAKLLKMRLDTGEITADQYTIELANIQTKLDKSIADLNKRRKGKFSIWTMLFGDVKEDGKGNVWKELSAEAQAFTKALESSMSMAFKYMDEWMDKRIEMAEIAVEAAQKETEAAKQLYDWEQEARVNGYANNVEYARREYEEKLRLEKEAIAEEQRLKKIQDGIDSATQASSLLTATANMWAAYTKGNVLGAVLAGAATAAMWTAFAAAKIKASQVTKYGDGMSEYLNYGGSHASGNDIDFGVDRNGRHRRVERGEMIGVINKRNVNKYGVNTITDIIDSLNKGTFENKFALADVVAPEMNADLYKLAFSGFERDMVDLGLVESSLKTLVEQGETKVVSIPGGRIEYKGNTKRIIRN